MTKKVALIAGAGPAGLTAAYELLKRSDIHPIVCEATDAIGGIAQTYNYKGNRIDIGGHRFFSKIDRVMDWWFSIMPRQGKPSKDTVQKQHQIDYVAESIVEILCPTEPERFHQKKRIAPDPEHEDDVMLQRPRSSRIFYRKSFFPYPIGITLTVARRLGILNTFLIGCSYIWRHTFPLKDETYLDAFYRNRFGDRLYKIFFEAYTEKVWGVPCSEIRADWGAQRVKGLSLKRAVVHAIKDLLSSDFAREQKERETSLITRFFYPKFGPGQMWEIVADRIRQAGGEVRMKTRVVGVERDGDSIIAATILDEQTKKTERIVCDYFFSTMPIRHLASMITPEPPADVQRVANGLIYRDFLTVGLLLKKLHVEERGTKPATEIPDTWIYIQERDVRVGRLQLFNNWSPYMVKDYEHTQWIGLEYFVNEGDDLWTMADASLIDFGIEEMVKIGLIKREDVLDGCVLRMPKAYPAYFGTYPELSVIRSYEIGRAHV